MTIVQGLGMLLVGVICIAIACVIIYLILNRNSDID
jgi:hypothetical protein